MPANLRTVTGENGHVYVELMCATYWRRLGSVRYVPPPGHGCYTAFDAGGTVIRLCADIEDAIAAIAQYLKI
jgi:hypothetical protein